MDTSPAAKPRGGGKGPLVLVILVGVIALVLLLALAGWALNNLHVVGEASNAFLLAIQRGDYQAAYDRILPDGRLQDADDLAQALRQTWPPVRDWRWETFSIEGDYAIVTAGLYLEDGRAQGIEILLYRIADQWVILNARLYSPEGIQPLW
jgi:hypothetical protein